MGFLQSLFGGKPSFAPWQNITTQGSQSAAIQNNLGALPQIEQLATGVDAFNQQQITQLLNNIMPGWAGMVSQAGKNVSSELTGQVPSDVQEALQTSAAARALTGGTGFGTGTIGGNNFVKSLGLTSLDLMGRGESSLESWSAIIDKIFAPGMFDVSSMFITPQQEFQNALQNELAATGQANRIASAAASADPAYGGVAMVGAGLLAGIGSGGAGGVLGGIL